MDVLTRLSRSAIVPVVVLDDAKGAVSTAHALLDGGIDAMEIAFRTAASADAIVAIARALDVSVDYLIADYNDSNNPSTLQVILDEIRGMTPKQLEMLQENIKTIKKFNA